MSDLTVALLDTAPTESAPPQPLFPLRVEGATLTRGRNALIENVDLTLSPGGLTALMGANGAGKSLFLRLLHGLIEPTAGRIGWGALQPAGAMPRQALVFQKPVLLRRSVRANLDFVLKNRGRDPALADHWLNHVGLAEKADQPARLLSGGEAQRLALARALATGPEVLLLDEPTASLDPASTLAIERIIETAKANGVTILLVTHDIGQARRLADDVAFLHAGRMVEHAPASSFFAKPRSEAARAYLEGRICL